MKTWVLLAALLFSTTLAKADPLVDVEPLDKVIAGAFYDVKVGRLLAGGYTHVLSYKKTVHGDLGIITDVESGNGGIMVGLSVDIKRLAKRFHLEYQPPKRLVGGTFLAYNFAQKDEHYGVYLGWEFGEEARKTPKKKKRRKSEKKRTTAEVDTGAGS